MRTVDQLERPPTLGSPIRQPAPQAPEWHQAEGRPKGIEQGPDGKLRNSVPTPPLKPLPGWPIFKRP